MVSCPVSLRASTKSTYSADVNLPLTWPSPLDGLGGPAPRRRLTLRTVKKKKKQKRTPVPVNTSKISRATTIAAQETPINLRFDPRTNLPPAPETLQPSFSQPPQHRQHIPNPSPSPYHNIPVPQPPPTTMEIPQPLHRQLFLFWVSKQEPRQNTAGPTRTRPPTTTNASQQLERKRKRNKRTPVPVNTSKISRATTIAAQETPINQTSIRPKDESASCTGETSTFLLPASSTPAPYSQSLTFSLSQHSRSPTSSNPYGNSTTPTPPVAPVLGVEAGTQTEHRQPNVWMKKPKPGNRCFSTDQH
ncbi:serine/arginine repetitive matrix protein 1-like [Macrobrachium nipponense]|uniref:serine/arginine repetitive matrix protein 1-like n=1 Tax=Macrobrachium nipponense TaxID=159736 RepID=UPI0030C7E110